MRGRRDEEVKSAIEAELAELGPSDNWDQYQKDKAKRIPDSVPARRPYSTEIRRVTVYMSGGRWAEGATFDDLKTLSGLSDEVPRSSLTDASRELTRSRVAPCRGS